MERVDRFRVGLIGYGLGGASFHAPLIAVTPGLELALVVTGNPARREQAGRDHPGAEVVPTADALWSRASELDLVVVASPNRTHVPLGLAALGAGLAVVVDKPLAATASEGRRLVDEARRRGLMLTAYQNRRWDGDFLTMRRLLAEGELGEPLRFESRLDRWRPVPKEGWRERGEPEDAGGLLYDLGAHLIDQALVLFGPVASVYAELDRRRPGVEVDDDVFLALTHRSGVRSHLWASSVAAQPGFHKRLLGSRAAYAKMHPDPQEGALRSGGRPGPGWGEEPPERWGTLGAGERVRAVPTLPGAYQAFYAGIVEALRGGAPPPVDPADAVAVLELIEAARRSSDERRVVAIAG
ncbi:MAG TPA: Gfo/Idh/MocA family oxidoreductase [Thermoanaerobaculia bacterium]|nr:Gfo/Idh/MocA family oxidoreductase [Thermoanaerobaculia bacterium]